MAHLTLGIHRGKSLVVTDDIAAQLDPICRAEAARMEEADPEDGARLLRHLADAGPSELDDLQTELSLTPKQLRQLRAPLERCGAIVARALVYEEPHRHSTSVLAALGLSAGGRRARRRDPREALGEPHLRRSPGGGRRARRRRCGRWFSWRWLLRRRPRRGARQGRSALVRTDGHVAAGLTARPLLHSTAPHFGVIEMGLPGPFFVTEQ